MVVPADAPVLVGLCDSPSSIAAVRLAAREAAARDRPLCMLHAFDWQAALEKPSVVGPHAEAEGLVDRATRIATEAAPGLTAFGRIVEGPPVAALIRASESAALVALGDGEMVNCRECVSQDAPAVQVAARAGCPVLVARSAPPPQGPVLVGIDGSPSSPTVLDYAFDCAARRDADLLVVQASDRDEDRLAEPVARCRERYPGLRVEHRTVPGEPRDVLIEQSRASQVVVVGPRGDQDWRGMLGEVSQGLIYHAPAPVIIVRGLAGGPVHRE